MNELWFYAVTAAGILLAVLGWRFATGAPETQTNDCGFAVLVLIVGAVMAIGPSAWVVLSLLIYYW